MYGFPEISLWAIAWALFRAVTPLWYGAILTVGAHLVLRRRRQIGEKMLVVGAITTAASFIGYWAIEVTLGDLLRAVGDYNLFVVCLLLETVVIVGGAVRYWNNPAIELRTPPAG